MTRGAASLSVAAAVLAVAQGALAEGVARSAAEEVARLSDSDASVRVSAAAALGSAPDPAVVPHLVVALRGDPSPEVRRAAALALHRHGTEEGREALAEAARSDPDPQVRVAVARLAGVTPAPLPPTEAAPPPAPLPPAEVAAAPPPATAVIVAPPPRPPQRRRGAPGRGLRISGWVLTGLFYGGALLTSLLLWPIGEGVDSQVTVDFAWKLAIPIVGPALAAATTWHGPETNAGLAAILNIPFWIWSLAQVTGVVLLSVGYGRASAEASAAASRPPGVAVALAGPGGTPGLSVAGWF